MGFPWRKRCATVCFRPVWRERWGWADPWCTTPISWPCCAISDAPLWITRWAAGDHVDVPGLERDRSGMLIADTVRGYVAVDGYEDISGVMDRDREVHARARPMRPQRTKTSPEVQSARDADPGDQGYAGLHGELAPRGRRRRRVDRDH